MEQLDNPAGRLHAVLGRLRARADGELMSQAIPAVFDLQPPDDLSQVLITWARLVAVPHEIRVAAARLPFSTDVTLKHLPAIEAHLGSLSLHHSIGNLFGGISPAALDNLESCSELLHVQYPEPSADAELLTSIRDAITDLLTAVRSLDHYDDELRGFLLDHLEEMETAVVHYGIVGTRAIERALQRALGDAVLRTLDDRRTGVPQEDQFSNRLAKAHNGSTFWKIFGRLADAVSIAGLLALGPAGGTTEVGPPVVTITIVNDTTVLQLPDTIDEDPHVADATEQPSAEPSISGSTAPDSSLSSDG